MPSLLFLDLEKVFNLFRFDQQDPLLFISSLFLFLFFFVLIFNKLFSFNNTIRILFLTVISFYFYYKQAGYYLFVLFLSIFLNYVGGLVLERKEGIIKRILLWIFILVNVGMLFFYKYINMIIDIFNKSSETNWAYLDLIIPIGISFYTFKVISYLVEVYYESIPAEKNIINFALYVAFFANVSAGPIDRANNFIPQERDKYFLSKNSLGTAVFLIVLGLIKKGIIADYIDINFVDRIFDWPVRYSGLENLFAVYGFTLQIYCDFSGYTDIAIGLSLLLGFRLMENFNYPYKAVSVADFWRRWHISLSTWLLDYIFKPLQIKFRRLKVWANVLGLLITFTICGVWHMGGINFETVQSQKIENASGSEMSYDSSYPESITPEESKPAFDWKTYPNFNYIVWGVLHAFLMMFAVLVNPYKNKLYKRFNLDKSKILKFIKVLITFNMIAFAWIFFKAKNIQEALDVINQIFTSFQPQILSQFIEGYPIIITMILTGYIIHFLPRKLYDFTLSLFVKMPFVFQGVFLAFIIWLVAQVRFSDFQPFLYFQF